MPLAAISEPCRGLAALSEAGAPEAQLSAVIADHVGALLAAAGGGLTFVKVPELYVGNLALLPSEATLMGKLTIQCAYFVSSSTH